MGLCAQNLLKIKTTYLCFLTLTWLEREGFSPPGCTLDLVCHMSLLFEKTNNSFIYFAYLKYIVQ